MTQDPTRFDSTAPLGLASPEQMERGRQLQLRGESDELPTQAELDERMRHVYAEGEGAPPAATPASQPPPPRPTGAQQYRTMPSTNAALDIARSTIGLNETTGRHALVSFLRNGGVNIDPTVTPWCAGWANAALTQAGMVGTGSLAARSFLNWGEPVTEPQIGDMVVLSRGSNPAHGHVGFFKGYDERGRILILGGNQSDAVNVQAYAANRLLGFRTAPGLRDEGPGYSGEERMVDMMNLAGDDENPLGLPGRGQEEEGIDVATGQRQGVTGIEAQPLQQAEAPPEQQATANQAATQEITERARAVLKRFGVTDESSVPRFDTGEELNAAIERGEVAPNSIALLEGRPVRVNA